MRFAYERRRVLIESERAEELDGEESWNEPLHGELKMESWAGYLIV